MESRLPKREQVTKRTSGTRDLFIHFDPDNIARLGTTDKYSQSWSEILGVWERLTILSLKGEYGGVDKAEMGVTIR